MCIKKLILPVLALLVLAPASYAQFSWVHEPDITLSCIQPDGSTIELFEMTKKFITQPDKIGDIKKCCKGLRAGLCQGYVMTDGNNLLHIAAYYGETDLVNYLKTECGFDSKEHWQFPTGAYGLENRPLKHRTELMYAAERNHLGTTGKLVALGAPPNTVNKDGKTAYTLTTDQKIMDFLAPLLSEAGGLKNVILDARRAALLESLTLDNIAEYIKRLDMFRDFDRLFNAT